ncbi:MAG: response regulator [Bacteroidota bacterium]
MKKLNDYVKKGRFYQSVVEDGSDIIFVVDYSGQILYHNNSVEEVLGYKPNKLVGRLFFDFILPDSLPQFKRNYSQSLRKPYNEGVEFQFLCSDQTYKYLEFNSINLKQKEGLEGLILDCRDITERKRDAEELLRAQKAKEQFLANISHEIRTPINGIAGMAALLSKDTSPEEKLIYLNAIRSAADNLKVIINDILDLASIESGKLRFEKIGFVLEDLLLSLIDTFTVQVKEKGLDLQLDLDPSADVILIGDPVRLNQILINLISNAIKFTHVGSIRVKCAAEKTGKKKAIIRFDVVDTGIGIPRDKLSTIFESFSQADASVTRKYGGTGLGLTIVKQLVELQNGKIIVESEEDKGSVFSVTIPYLLGTTEDVTHDALTAQQTDSYRNTFQNLKVLLVEDNDINRLYANSILRNWNCAIEMAENGYVALEKIKNQHFDIILMDVQMPVMDGFEATKAIRQGDAPKSQTPIIALTANATRADIERCLMAGMNDCIPKPFTPEDLFRILVKYYSPNSGQVSEPVETVDLSHLKQVSNNNDAFVQEMIDTFIESIPKSIDDIKTSARARDWQQLARALHKIKPSLSMVGLNNTRALVVDLEQQAKNKTALKSLPLQVNNLCKQLQLAVNQLKQL